MSCYELSGWAIKRLDEQVLYQKELTLKTRGKDFASHARMNNHRQQQPLLQTGECKKYVIRPFHNSSNRSNC